MYGCDRARTATTRQRAASPQHISEAAAVNGTTTRTCALTAGTRLSPSPRREREARGAPHTNVWRTAATAAAQHGRPGCVSVPPGRRGGTGGVGVEALLSRRRPRHAAAFLGSRATGAHAKAKEESPAFACPRRPRAVGPRRRGAPPLPVDAAVWRRRAAGRSGRCSGHCGRG